MATEYMHVSHSADRQVLRLLFESLRYSKTIPSFGTVRIFARVFPSLHCITVS